MHACMSTVPAVPPSESATLSGAPQLLPPALSAREKRYLIWLIAFSFFMQMLDSTIVNTATPSIARALEVNPLSLRSALISYVLSLAVFIPISAWFADRYGTRRVFGAAILIFTLGSLACGLASSLWMLTAARVVQGFGGAMMMPVGRLALVRSFDKSEFVNALSIATIPGLIGPAIGPVLGGFFSVYLSWRMIFFVNIPFGIAGIWMTRRFMPDYRGPQGVPLDVAGFVLLALGMGGFSWALEQAADGDFLPAALMAGAACALLGVYVRRSFRITAPIADLRLMRIPSFRIAFTSGFATRLGVGGMYFLLTLLFQIGFGYSAIMAGLLQLPQAIAMILMRFFVSGIIKQYGYRRVLLFNTALSGVLVILFATFTATTPIWLICVQLFVYGFVMSLQYSAMNTLGFLDLAPFQASMGSSITSAVQNLSMSLGIAFASVLMAAFIGAAHDNVHYVAAFRATTIVLGVVTVLSSMLFLRLPRSATA
jgi:EmrB/QacA subfamily drug resistance transporter